MVLWSMLATLSCGGAVEAPGAGAPDRDEDADGAVELTILDEVVVEGLPDEAEPGEPGGEASQDALAGVGITLAAPYHAVRAVRADLAGGRATRLVLRTDAGWVPMEGDLLAEWDDDPGCPSIERERRIVEIRVERGVLVVVTESDRTEFADDTVGTLVLHRARACALEDDAVRCGASEIVEAAFVGETSKDALAFATRYWIDADGELEIDEVFDAGTSLRE